IVAEAQLARRLLHLVLAPVQLFPADGDQLLGRIRDHLGRQLDHQALAANRVPDDVAGIAGTRGARAAAPAPQVLSPPPPPPAPGRPRAAAPPATPPAACAFSHGRGGTPTPQTSHSFAQ